VAQDLAVEAGSLVAGGVARHGVQRDELHVEVVRVTHTLTHTLTHTFARSLLFVFVVLLLLCQPHEARGRDEEATAAGTLLGTEGE
jgi:hypothetical protein